MALTCIPIVDIHAENITENWPSLILAIKSATFIALDLEMSGIGNRKDTMTRDSNERYKAFCEIAKTRSILSVGISSFSLQQHGEESNNPGKNKNSDFLVQTYNIMLLRKDSFTVEPGSLKFLLEHGFDFNTHYAKAISYSLPQKKDLKDSSTDSKLMSNVFFEMLRSKKPIVVHNGFLDLVFLYQNFYSDLPSSLLTFLADLSIMFSAGVVDTKYIAEFVIGCSATYLNYIFKKSWRENVEKKADNRSHIKIECCEYPSHADVSFNSIRNKTSITAGSIFPCEHYAAHGYCSKGMQCKMSHDIDVILNYEEEKKSKKKKRKRKRKRKEKDKETFQELPEDKTRSNEDGTYGIFEEEFPESPSKSPLSNLHTNNQPINSASGNHRAGFDAFMTGFCMACYHQKLKKHDDREFVDGIPELINKLNLGGKDIPLKVEKSSYCKTSANHNETWKRVMMNT